MLRPVPGAKQRNVSVPQNAPDQKRAKISAENQGLVLPSSVSGCYALAATNIKSEYVFKQPTFRKGGNTMN